MLLIPSFSVCIRILFAHSHRIYWCTTQYSCTAPLPHDNRIHNFTFDSNRFIIVFALCPGDRCSEMWFIIVLFSARFFMHILKYSHFNYNLLNLCYFSLELTAKWCSNLSITHTKINVIENSEVNLILNCVSF